jgi:DNA-binding MarR family transcriptional regulator
MTPTPNADALDRLETEMAVLTRRIEHASRRSELYRDLDRAGYLLARTIDDVGPASVNQLAVALGLDGSTVTRQVAALEAKVLVERHADPDDGRVAIIELTGAGRQAMQVVRAARAERLDRAVHDWSADDVGRLAVLLARLNRSLAVTTTPAAAPPGPVGR